MKIVLKEKGTGIKIAWFFMIITIGAFLNELKGALSEINTESGGFDRGFKNGYEAGGKLGSIFFLGMGMLLYSRTKKRKFGHLVKGSKIVDYILVFILSINFIFPLLSGRWINGTEDDLLAFNYVAASLLAYVYVLLAKPKVELPKKTES